MPGIGNKWGLPPAIELDGWIEITDSGERLHWRLDREEMEALRAEWRALHGDMQPQTTRDLNWFSERYKCTRL